MTVWRPPVVGSCPQCAAHRFGIELYSFQLTEPDQVLTWDVKRARELVNAHGAVGEPQSAVEAIEWVQKYGNVDQAHLAHLPAWALDEPILVDAIYRADKPGAPETLFPIIIDGSHRILRCVMARRPLASIMLPAVLTPDEQRQVLTVTPGRIEELVR
jgi:hypothetical protein